MPGGSGVFKNAKPLRFKGTVDEAGDAAWVGGLEFGWEGGIGEALEADGAGVAEDGSGADRGAGAVRGGGVRAAVDHGGVDFDAGGEAVDDEATGFLLENLEKVSGLGEFLVGGVDGGGELALKTVCGGDHILF